jgi:hypothetical protein
LKVLGRFYIQSFNGNKKSRDEKSIPAFDLKFLKTLFKSSHIINDGPDFICIRNFLLKGRHIFSSFSGFVIQGAIGL